MDGGLVGLRQLREDLLQRLDAGRLVQVRVPVERLEELRVILVGEERLRQIAQVRLEDARHRVDVHLLEQLLRLVRVRLERLFQLGHVRCRAGHPVDADLGHSAPLDLPHAGAHDEWNVTLFASEIKVVWLDVTSTLQI